MRRLPQCFAVAPVTDWVTPKFPWRQKRLHRAHRPAHFPGPPSFLDLDHPLGSPLLFLPLFFLPSTVGTGLRALPGAFPPALPNLRCRRGRAHLKSTRTMHFGILLHSPALSLISSSPCTFLLYLHSPFITSFVYLMIYLTIL